MLKAFLLLPLAWLAALFFFLQGPAFAQTPVTKDIRNHISKTMEVDRQVQNLKANWKNDARELADQIEQLEKESAALKKHLEKETLRLALEEKQHRENLRREKEAARVRTELSAFLDSVLGRLETAITSDLPFLSQERNGRILSLKEMMVAPGESSAEKVRRVFEALQIEAEYGTSVEVTQENIRLGNKEVLVDMLRLGRVSLFCQTLDLKKSGVFDPASAKWRILPEKVNRDLSRAIAMARQERSIELVNLPLGKIIR